MSFASVSSPAPARGGPGTPAAPSRSVGGLPTVAALSNPNIRASNPGTQVNMSVNVGIMCRPWSRDYQNHYKEGDLLFVHVGTEHVSGSLRRVANLPVMNMMKDREAKENAEDTRVPEAAQLSNYDNWRFFGVLVSVMDQGNQQRLFGVTVQGRASVINYWGDKLKPLDKLYIVAERLTRDEAFAINGGKKAFQNTQPHLLARTGKKVNGPALCIGFVGIRPHNSNVPEAHLDKACQVQHLSNQLKRIEIFLRR